MYGLELTTGPALEPITVAEATAWLRLELNDDSAIISDLIVDARTAVEKITGRQLIHATWLMTLDGFFDRGSIERAGYFRAPLVYLDGGVIRLPRSPVVAGSVEVKYYDTAGALTTLATTEYQVDVTSNIGRIAPAPTKFWPATQTNRLGAVRVTFQAGYSGLGSGVPGPIKRAMKLAIASWYEDRGDEPQKTELPPGAMALLDGYIDGDYR